MSLLTDIEAYADLASGNQQEYFKGLLNVAKPVEVVSIKDVFTKDEIKMIKRLVRPKKKMCYRNSHLLTLLFPDKVKYVEGRFSCSFIGLPIDHAFNRVGDKYVDITVELALKEDVTEHEYIKFAEYDSEQIDAAAYETGYYGEYYKFYWMKRKNKEKIL